MENPNRQHFSPHVDTSSETREAAEVRVSAPTNVNAQNRAIDLLTTHDAKLRDLAHYLHDEIGQLLVSSSMHLYASVESEPVSPHLTTCLTIVQQAIERLRELTSQLHPSILEHMPLPEALRCSLDDRGCRDEVAIELSTPSCWVPLPPAIEVTCYRVVMQVVEHAILHQATDRIRVDVRQDAETVNLTIRDIGTPPGSDLLPSCRNRFYRDGWKESCQRIEWLGGNWQIDSTSGQGETVRVRLPIDLDATSSSKGDASEEPS